ncbi:processed acidic surface protein [Terribacillus saccharophilus]|uniref:processed acidic surface protein n=1 Tax=Terribacillus saccharophilus TaxID=361277 RepID=UPI00382E27B1
MTKKLLVGIIMVLLCLQVVAPQTTSAAIKQKDLEAYAAELGTDLEGLNRYLVDFEWGTIEEFEVSSIDELREWLGEPVTDENFQSFLDETGCTVDQLNARLEKMGLSDKGYTAEDILLYSDLYWVMGEPVNAENVQMLAEELGLTEKELADLFYENGLDLYSYSSMDDIYEVIYNDINSVSLYFLLQEVEMTQEELDQLLKENDVKLEDFTSYDELAEFIYTESDYYFEMAWEELNGEFPNLQTIGISKEEYRNFYDHLNNVFENIDEAFFDKLFGIMDRVEALGDFETLNELDESQRKEIVSIWNEAMDLFQLKAKFYLSDGTTQEEVTIEELSKLTEIKDQILFVELYDAKGNLLLDFTVTGEDVGSGFIPAIEKPVTEEKPASNHEAPVKEKVTVTPKIATETVKQEEGKRLPDTASPVGNILVAGTVLMAAGAALYTWNRRKKHSN